MTKRVRTGFHISTRTQSPVPCYAPIGKCPVKPTVNVPTIFHGQTKAEVAEQYAASMAEQTVQDPLQKTPPDDPFNVFEAAMKRRIETAKEEAAKNGEPIPQWIINEQHLAAHKALVAQYDLEPYRVENEFKGFEFSDPRLVEYNNDYAELAERLTVDELEGLHDYTGITYSIVNEYFYDREKFNEGPTQYHEKRVAHTQQTIERLDAIMEKAIPKQRTLYRVISQQDTKGKTLRSADWAASLGYTVGNEIEFPTYLSTTIDPTCAQRYVNEDSSTAIMFVFETDQGVPVDTTATHREELTHTQKGEREILLPRDMKFRVSKVEKTRVYDRDGDFSDPFTVYLEPVHD